MVIWRRMTLILNVTTLIVFATRLTGVAADGTVAFNPEVSHVLSQQTFNVDINVDEALTGAHCYMVTVDFDHSLLELLAVAEGPWLQSQGGTFFFWEDTGEGCDLGVCLLGYGLYADGPGVVATLTFRAVASSGTSILEFGAAEFTDISLDPISVIPVDGAVTISSSQCCVGRVGDANGSGEDEPTIGDVSLMVDAKFLTASCDGMLNCLTEADVNRSGGSDPICDDITIGDISALIDYLFILGPETGILLDCL